MSSSITDWHIVTPEFPPTVGGVSDYTATVAHSLAEHGQTVHVWTTGSSIGTLHIGESLFVHRFATSFSLTGLKQLSRELNRFPAPRRLLIQYVPHGYGFKAMNLGFAMWVWIRRWIFRDTIDVMFHEVSYPWVISPLQHNLIAAVNRLMALLISRSASRMFVSIPFWRELLQPYAHPRKPIVWSPIPAAGVFHLDQRYIGEIRRELCPPGSRILGHFGTYGQLISPLLFQLLPELLADSRNTILLLGLNSLHWRDEFVNRYPDQADRILAPGHHQLYDIVHHLAACDLVILPYPDGLSSRRTTAMLPLAHGVPVLSNRGRLTESIWDSSQFELCDSPMALARLANELLDQPERRARLGRVGAALYAESFAVVKTVHQLLGM